MSAASPDLDNRFDLHPATDETGPVMDQLRAQHKALAAVVEDLCPAGRERSLALTQIEQALFWANAAVARTAAAPPPPF